MFLYDRSLGWQSLHDFVILDKPVCTTVAQVVHTLKKLLIWRIL